MNTAPTPSFQHAQGFTVVELMVSMAISLLLLVGVVSIFSSSKTTYETVERLSRVQENGRFALDAITRDIRSAGYVGCSRPSGFENTLRSQTQLQWNFAQAIIGYDYQGSSEWSPTRDTAMTNMVTTGLSASDALVLRVPTHDSRGGLRLVEKMASSTAALEVAPITSGTTSPIKQNQQILMVADCQARAVFEVTSYTQATGEIQHAVSSATTTTPGNATDDLQHAFGVNAVVVPMQTVAYYVGSSDGRTGLWRVVGGGTPQELIEGVERMEVTFGIDTSGSDRVADVYVGADAVTNWDNVISVNVALLVRAPEEYGTQRDTRTYTLLNNTYVAPGDRFLRQVFVTTATLRNRAL